MYEVPKEILQEFLNYLAQRPYAEVFQIVSKLTTLKAKQEPTAEVTSESASEVVPSQED